MDFENEVEKISKIARLKLSNSEKQKYASDLASVIQTFEKLDEIRTEELKIASKPNSQKSREDIVSKSTIEPLSNTRHKKDNYFIGPRLVD